MSVHDAWLLAMARPGQINPGWVAFWKTPSTSGPADGAVWTVTDETWYLATDLAALAQKGPLTVKKVGVKLGDYPPPPSLTGRVHAINTPANPGFLTGLTKYFVILNSNNATVAVVGQSQSSSVWIEHWWLDQAWVDLASTTGTTVVLTVESQTTASTAYGGFTSPTYKKHTFTP